jgi:NAD(P)-dependent dehydrogenase (short-subunit alcohol dehydrogenase family)
MEPLLLGKVALVTGAAGGIGLATAKAFAKADAAVAFVDQDEAGVMKAAHELSAVGHKALGLCCDITDEQQVKMCTERTIVELGGLHIACNAICKGVQNQMQPPVLAFTRRFVVPNSSCRRPSPQNLLDT